MQGGDAVSRCGFNARSLNLYSDGVVGRSPDTSSSELLRFSLPGLASSYLMADVIHLRLRVG